MEEEKQNEALKVMPEGFLNTMNGFDVRFDIVPGQELIEMLITDLLIPGTDRVFLNIEDAKEMRDALDRLISDVEAFYD